LYGTKDNAECWRAVFKSLKDRGLDTSAVRIGIMDGLVGLENLFKESFPNAITGRCWVHALKNTLAKVPERLRETFHQMALRVMYASSENKAREAFLGLKTAMKTDAERAVHCLEKDLDSLLVQRLLRLTKVRPDFA
jgi:putative transposase